MNSFDIVMKHQVSEVIGQVAFLVLLLTPATGTWDNLVFPGTLTVNS